MPVVAGLRCKWCGKPLNPAAGMCSGCGEWHPDEDPREAA